MRHRFWLTAMVAGAGLLGCQLAWAQDQGKQLSETSVKTLMNYAWTILPAKFTSPQNKTIEVDKSKRDALVPVEVARDVIKVGYMSAQAQLCDMLEDQAANYDAMMAREIDKKKWTDQQLLYITTLHRMTIHMAAGKLRVVEKGTDELQILLEPIEPSKDTCNDERRKRVKETIQAYVSGAPKGYAIGTSRGTAVPAPAAAQPVPAAAPAAEKKK